MVIVDLRPALKRDEFGFHLADDKVLERGQEPVSRRDGVRFIRVQSQKGSTNVWPLRRAV